MAKNMTRRALALGSGVALVATGLATASPAYAAAELYIAPDAGTSYNVLATDDFTLKAFGNSDLTFSDSTDIQWEIEKASGQTVAVDDDTSVSSGLSAGTGSTTTKAWYDPDAGTTSTTAGGNKFTIDPVGNSTYKTSEVKVRAYIELDGSDGFTSGDLGSEQVTVKFLGSADVNANVSVASFFEGGANNTIVATVDGINYHQANANDDLAVDVIDNGSAQGETAMDGVDSDYTYFYYTYTNASLTATDVIGAELYADEYEGASRNKVATASFVTSTTSDADTIDDMGISRGATVRAAGDDFDDNTTLDADAAQEYIIKEGTTSFTVSAVIKEGSEPLSGATVSVTVAEDGDDGVATGTVIRAGGESFTGDALGGSTKDLSYTATTNASGVVSATITTDGATLGDALDITFAAGDTSSVTDTVAVEWQANDIDGVYVTSKPASGVVEAVAGSSKTATVAVLDDFGQNWSDSTATYRMATALTGSSTAAVAAVTYSGSPVNISFSDSSLGALTATFTLEEQGSNSSWATAEDGDTSSVSTDDIVFQVKSAAEAPALVTATAYNGATGTTTLTNPNGLELVDYANTDTRLPNATTAPASASNNISGTVLTASGAANDGVDVTISAPGVGFVSGTTHSFDSITVKTDASGQYEVGVYSHTAGEISFTVTSGGVSPSSAPKIEFGPVDDNSGAILTIDAPDTVQPGSTLVATALLTDKYGNPVDVADANTDSEQDFSFSSDSPGVQIGSDPGTTDSKGMAKLQYLLGSNDNSGTITITAKYDKNGDNDYTDFGDLVVVKTVTIGEVAVDYGTQKAWTVDQGDGTAKVYVKFPEIDGKLRILHQTGGSGSYDSIYSKTTSSETMDGLRIVEGVGTYVVRTIDLADGTNRIRVSVDGDDIEVNGKDRPARYNE